MKPSLRSTKDADLSALKAHPMKCIVWHDVTKPGTYRRWWSRKPLPRSMPEWRGERDGIRFEITGYAHGINHCPFMRISRVSECAAGSFTINNAVFRGDEHLLRQYAEEFDYPRWLRAKIAEIDGEIARCRHSLSSAINRREALERDDPTGRER